MKAAPSGPVVLYFPHMNPSFIPSSVPSGVRLMDPGRSAGHDGRCWRPEILPYDQRQVQGMVREYLSFGERFSKPSDMSHFQVRGLDDFYTDSRQAIQSELQGGRVTDPDPRPAALQKAQMVLALGEMLEERMAEMRSLETRVNESRANFAQVLGLDSGEDEDLIPVEYDGAGGECLPWERLLEPFLCFLPEGGALLFSDPAVQEELEGRGVRFSPLQERDAAALLPGASVPVGSALARVRTNDIFSPESASSMGDREFMLIFWKTGR